jgi:hypothetical protein
MVHYTESIITAVKYILLPVLGMTDVQLCIHKVIS